MLKQDDSRLLITFCLNNRHKKATKGFPEVANVSLYYLTIGYYCVLLRRTTVLRCFCAMLRNHRQHFMLPLSIALDTASIQNLPINFIEWLHTSSATLHKHSVLSPVNIHNTFRIQCCCVQNPARIHCHSSRIIIHQRYSSNI